MAISVQCPCGRTVKGYPGATLKCPVCGRSVSTEATKAVAIPESAKAPAIHFVCPWCQEKLSADAGVAGKPIKCSSCQRVVKVPAGVKEVPDGEVATGKKTSKKRPTKFGKAELKNNDLDRFQCDLWVLICPRCSAQLPKTWSETVNGIEYIGFQCKCYDDTGSRSEYLVDRYTKEIFIRNEANARRE